MLPDPAVTVKATPLLATPPTDTTTLPVVAPVGTGATMLVLLQLVGAAAVPLKVSELVPWVEPKLLPLMVTDVPTGPPVGFTVVIAGGEVRGKGPPFLGLRPLVPGWLRVAPPPAPGPGLCEPLHDF